MQNLPGLLILADRLPPPPPRQSQKNGQDGVGESSADEEVNWSPPPSSISSGPRAVTLNGALDTMLPLNQ